MTITADELAAIRIFAPTTWTPTAVFADAAVTAVWNREATEPEDSTDEVIEATSQANVYRVALRLSQAMRAGLIADPDSFSIGGEYSESRGAGMNALMSQIAELKALDALYGSVVAGTNLLTSHILCRPNFHGR